MFSAKIENIDKGRVKKYTILQNEKRICFFDALELWKTNSDFILFFSELLAGSPFNGYLWETPALTRGNASQLFEFVLLNSPEFGGRQTDKIAFKEYFEPDNSKQVVEFSNLHGDATLVVPTPQSNDRVYGHLAAFLRGATSDQLISFWQRIGISVQSKLSKQPLWLSTAGGGVAWLHVRIDSAPKYYRHSPYRKFPTTVI